MINIDKANNDAILEALEEDGANLSDLCALLQAAESTVAQIVRSSAGAGCLLWTKQHIVSTHRTCPFEYKF